MFEGIVRHGTLMAVIALILCVLGVVAALRIPVQMIPDLEVRTVTVRTSWPGAMPQDIEKEIVIEQEEYLRNIPSLQRIISTASFGQAQVELEFPYGVDMNETLIRINNALSQVPSYPLNVDEPQIYAASFSANSFMYFRVALLPGNPRQLDMVLMRDFIEDNVRTRMERVAGVSEVRVGGGAERQIQILLDPARPAGMEMTLTSDDVRYVQASVVNIWKNLVIGAIFATLVMYLFLRSRRATAVGVIGIPICTIAGFLGLLLVIGATATASAAVIVWLTPPAEYLPEGEEPKTFAVMNAPPGYNLETMSAIADELQAYFLPFVEDSPERFERGETAAPREAEEPAPIRKIGGSSA